MNLPVIRIEIEGMRQTIAHAMSQHLAEIDTGVQEALKEACENFDYRAHAVNEATACIKRALSNAIAEQFQYGGAGYKAIQAVAKSMAETALKNVVDE